MTTTPAYVSEGRWVISCPFCNEGAIVAWVGQNNRGTWNWADVTCGSDPRTGQPVSGCGATLRPKKPRNVATVDDVLLKRPLPNRHYFPSGTEIYGNGVAETVADLIAENVAHGVG